MNPVLYTQLFNWVGQLGVVSKFVMLCSKVSFDLLVTHPTQLQLRLEAVKIACGLPMSKLKCKT